MSEFVGRTGALRVYSYPERQGGSPLSLLARNFAFGPADTTDIFAAGTPVPWAGIDVGSPGIDVQITPRSTGIILIRGVITVKSLSGVQENIALQVVVNGTPLQVPFFEQPTIEPAVSTGSTVIAILTELNATTFPSLLPLGVLANVEIILSAENDGVLQLVTDSSSLDVQEVPAATG